MREYLREYYCPRCHSDIPAELLSKLCWVPDVMSVVCGGFGGAGSTSAGGGYDYRQAHTLTSGEIQVLNCPNCHNDVHPALKREER